MNLSCDPTIGSGNRFWSKSRYPKRARSRERSHYTFSDWLVQVQVFSHGTSSGKR
jgi:hypothetical protein